MNLSSIYLKSLNSILQDEQTRSKMQWSVNKKQISESTYFDQYRILTLQKTVLFSYFVSEMVTGKKLEWTNLI